MLDLCKTEFAKKKLINNRAAETKKNRWEKEKEFKKPAPLRLTELEGQKTEIGKKGKEKLSN